MPLKVHFKFMLFKLKYCEQLFCCKDYNVISASKNQNSLNVAGSAHMYVYIQYNSMTSALYDVPDF